jgi:hypothetical protein
MYNSRSTIARDTAFREARRESAGSIHRCHGKSVSPSVSYPNGIQPQRKEILSFQFGRHHDGWACGAPQAHRGFPHLIISGNLPFQSDQPPICSECFIPCMLAALLVLYRSPLLHFKKKEINGQGGASLSQPQDHGNLVPTLINDTTREQVPAV